MAEKYLKCSKSLVIREMQIKTPLRFHVLLIRMAKMNKTNDSLYWWACSLSEATICCGWEGELEQPLWKSLVVYEKTCESIYLKIQLYHPKDLSPYYRDTCSSMCFAALFIIPRNMKWLRRSPTKKYIRKMYVYTVAILRSH